MTGRVAPRRPPRAASPPGNTVRRIYEHLPFTDVASLAAPTTTEFPLEPTAGSAFQRPEQEPGRIAVFVAPHRDGPRTTMVVEQGDFTIAFVLTSGQLHRLTNGLAGRGLRNTIRPISVDDEPVQLTGSPTLLEVTVGERLIEIPAGPKRALSKALRALEKQPLLG